MPTRTWYANPELSINETLKEKGILLFFPVRFFALFNFLAKILQDRSCARSNDWRDDEYRVLWK